MADASRAPGPEQLEALLAEQVTYYQARAPEYGGGALDLAVGGELLAALESFEPRGRVLELACGTGAWTAQLLRYADSVTAVDAALAMLAIASERTTGGRVRFIEADLFRWRPDRRYDVVFFGFWLSHVPLERFERFWSLVAECLEPKGRVFFVDDAYRTRGELIDGEPQWMVCRRVGDGTAYRAVKVSHRPKDLEERLSRLGWRIQVTPTSGPFFWGAGGRDTPSAADPAPAG